VLLRSGGRERITIEAVEVLQIINVLVAGRDPVLEWKWLT
jgi:hypothetical protein